MNLLGRANSGLVFLIKSQSINLTRHGSTLSNKRITRIPPDTKVDQSELSQQGNEQYLNVKAVNRNPRNLEQLLLEPKPMGFELDQKEPHFWNKYDVG